MLNPAVYARQNLDTAVGMRTPAITNLPTPLPPKPVAPLGSTPRRRSRRAPTPPGAQIERVSNGEFTFFGSYVYAFSICFDIINIMEAMIFATRS